MALGSHLITVRRLKKYIDDVIGKKANLPDTSKTIIGNISQINTDLSIVNLWSNPDPNSAFAEQDVNLSTDDYNYLTIYYLEYAGRNYMLSNKVLKGHGLYLSAQDVNNLGQSYDHTRSVDYVNDTKLHFNANYLQGVGTDNSHCVPFKIIGTKI